MRQAGVALPFVVRNSDAISHDDGEFSRGGSRRRVLLLATRTPLVRAGPTLAFMFALGTRGLA